MASPGGIRASKRKTKRVAAAKIRDSRPSPGGPKREGVGGQLAQDLELGLRVFAVGCRVPQERHTNRHSEVTASHSLSSHISPVPALPFPVSPPGSIHTFCPPIFFYFISLAHILSPSLLCAIPFSSLTSSPSSAHKSLSVSLPLGLP